MSDINVTQVLIVVLGIVVGMKIYSWLAMAKDFCRKLNEIYIVAMNEVQQKSTVNFDQCKQCKLALDYTNKMLATGKSKDTDENKVMGFKQ